MYFDRRLDSAQGLLDFIRELPRDDVFSVARTEFGNIFYHDTGIGSEYFIDSASLREPRCRYLPGCITRRAHGFSLDLKYVHTA
ncbi:MAG: hypothetical protein U1F16_09555 [Turneriella sp.]